MIAFLTMWHKPNVTLDCKELIVKEGVKIDVGGGEQAQMLVVIASDGIFSPVLDIEVS